MLTQEIFPSPLNPITYYVSKRKNLCDFSNENNGTLYLFLITTPMGLSVDGIISS